MNPAPATLTREDRREAILAIASEVFRETGYAAASMSMIAARLGGSKGTLYNYFKSKEALLEAHVQRQCQSLWNSTVDWPKETAGIAATLQAIGERYIKHVLSDDLVANFRLLIAESPRSPELGRSFYEAGPAHGVRRVAEFLDAAEARGELVCDDTQIAAGQFLNLCRAGIWMERLLNLVPAPSSAQAADHAGRAVKVFMAAYGR